MKQDFTLQNIKDFMKQELNLVWYGEICDDQTGLYRRAQLSDFSELKYLKFFVTSATRNENKGLYPYSTMSDYIKIMVSNNIFRVAPGQELSPEWRDFKSYKAEDTLNI